MSSASPVVGIIMGSQSDWPTMQHAAQVLDELKVSYEKRIISAHRTPERLYDYAKNARQRGLKVDYCRSWRSCPFAWHDRRHDRAAGTGCADQKPRPFRPRQSCYRLCKCQLASPLARWRLAIPGATNSGLLAAQILAISDDKLMQRLVDMARATLKGCCANSR